MSLRRWRLGAPTWISLSVLLSGGVFAGTSSQSTDFSEVDNTIDGLRQVSKNLSDALKQLNARLDDAVAHYDRGYRSSDGRQIEGADADMLPGPADLMQSCMRKFAAFRILAARSDRYQPAVLADLDTVQKLILEAVKRTADSDAVLRRLLVVPVGEFDRHGESEVKVRHDQLLKARASAEQAAQRAWLELPLDEQVEMPINVTALPLHIERRKRFTLINEGSYRMALSDSGIEDQSGRHLFYEEEWAQRGMTVIRRRWRVALDTRNGEHILIKRYAPLELSGTLQDLYQYRDRDYLWCVEPFDERPRPPLNEVEAALAGVADSRAAIGAATQRFSTTVQAALAREDQRSSASHQPILDSGQSESFREAFYAIRAHLAGVGEIIQAESEVRLAIEDAVQKVADLEPQAAWANRPSSDSTDWDRLEQRSDHEIDLLRNAEQEAIALLPPDTPEAEARFPAFSKDTIIRLRRLSSQDPKDGLVRFIEEIWRPGSREVMRTATLVVVDRKTGNQTVGDVKTKVYRAPPGAVLEQVFDENAADNILLRPSS